MVMVLALCNFPYGPLSVYSFIYLQYLFALYKLTIAKIRKENNSVIIVIELRFLHSALFLMVVYQCIKIHLIAIFTFTDMLRKTFLLQTLRRERTP